MARYLGPKTKISRIFGEPITGNGKWLTKNSNPPGMHGANRKRKTSLIFRIDNLFWGNPLPPLPSGGASHPALSSAALFGLAFLHKTIPGM